MTIDVVCQMKVDETNPEIPKLVYEDKEYYFCTNLCMVHFQANPQKYLREYNNRKVKKDHKGKGNPSSQ